MGHIFLSVLIFGIFNSVLRNNKKYETLLFNLFIILLFSLLFIPILAIDFVEHKVEIERYGEYKLFDFEDNIFLYADENENKYVYNIEQDNVIKRYGVGFNKDVNIKIIKDKEQPKLIINKNKEFTNNDIFIFMYGNIPLDNYKTYNFYIPKDSYKRGDTFE